MIAKNFYSIAIAITTLVMFGFWILAKTIVDNYHFLTPLIAAFTSVGVYKAAFYCLILLSRKYTYIKKLILGKNYFEGVWVGFYYGVSGKERYLIEVFTQDIFELRVKGYSFDENFKQHTTWHSEPVHINTKQKQITYLYQVKTSKENTDAQGISCFEIEYNSHQCPNTLIGYSKDMHLNRKCKAFEKKITNKTYFGKFEIPLEEAKRVFSENKILI